MSLALLAEMGRGDIEAGFWISVNLRCIFDASGSNLWLSSEDVL